MLNGTVTRAVLACGLDPSAGVLHSSSRNKPAIVLDLMEPFRAPVADSVVRNLFTQGTLKKNDFMFLRGKVSLKQSGRRALSGAYNEFLDNKHNYLGSGKLSWERSIEYVVRAMVRFIDGSSDTWESVYVK
ncbi:MAG: CRISPR-associated endonuclease Cas1 [Spirochaetes bacterium]|jgi:CRISPR-associated protein Cas1|nr:MAG: CRISPR-associated endonuclease Cas1 [Spirochaetota bacterium]